MAKTAYYLLAQPLPSLQICQIWHPTLHHQGRATGADLLKLLLTAAH